MPEISDDLPPKGATNGRTPPPPPAPAKNKPAAARLKPNVQGLYYSLGMMISATVDGEYGGLVMMQADPISQAWVDLADKSPATLKFLERFTQGGAAGELFVMHLLLLVPLLHKLGYVPDEINSLVMVQYNAQRDN